MTYKFELLEKIYAIKYPSRLDAAVMAYGDWQAASDEDLADAEEAAAELLRLRKIAAAAESLNYRMQNFRDLQETDPNGDISALPFLLFDEEDAAAIAEYEAAINAD